MCSKIKSHFKWKATRVAGFQEAIACNREDPTQSVSVTAGVSNHQLQSSVEAYVHTTSLEQKPKISALMSSTRIVPGGNWAVGLQVPSLKRFLGYQNKHL
jgi:hypothetical protein